MNRAVAWGLMSLLVACSTAERRVPTDSSGDDPLIDAPAGGSTTDGASSDSTTSAGNCGNGTVNNGEACDDNNAASNDGCSSACALEATQVVTVNALNLSVPDDAYNGTLGSMGCASVAVTAWYTPAIATATVTLGIDHTWVGDLTIKAVAPDNTTVTLASRPGLVEPADTGVAGTSYGTNSILAKGLPITFQDGAATSAEAMGAGASPVCQSNNVCMFAPAAGSAAAGTLAAFNGKPSTGTWKLCIGDSTFGDTGKIDRVTFTFTH